MDQCVFTLYVKSGLNMNEKTDELRDMSKYAATQSEIGFTRVIESASWKDVTGIFGFIVLTKNQFTKSVLCLGVCI